MEFLADPSIWAGLITLIVLEIVLGIDNLVFIAILADKVEPRLRDRARIMGLTLALVMRIGMLSVVSWFVTLTKPIVEFHDFSFSWRDIILLVGGLFLLFKATIELHERLEGHEERQGGGGAHLGFWLVITQIIVLDAVFSLDSVITAVGMVDQLEVMVIAVVVAMGVMIVASKSLTEFVNSHPTVIVLCLSFLLMIGFSLIADAFGFEIPKGYLYAAIGFSILIEFFNQTAMRNRSKHEQRLPLRQRTADAIFRILGTEQQIYQEVLETGTTATTTTQKKEDGFGAEERFMVTGVLSLAERSIRTIMTPRNDVSWVDATDSREDITAQLLDAPHSMFPVCQGSLDNVIGVVLAKELLKVVIDGGDIAKFAAASPPIMIPDTVDILRSLKVLRTAQGSLVLVVDEYGQLQGLLTPLDVLEAIAGEFPDADEVPDVVSEDGAIYARGLTNLHQLEIVLGGLGLSDAEEDIATLSGLLLHMYEQIPDVGESFVLNNYRFEVVEVSDHRVERVKITPVEAQS